MPLSTIHLKELRAFSDLLAHTGQHLPLDFITGMFDFHKKNSKDGEGHYQLVKAIKTVSKLIDPAIISDQDIALTYAIIFLSNTGEVFSDEVPYEVSAGLTFVLLRKFIPGFFTGADARFISVNCRPIYPQSLKLSLRVKIQLLIHSTRVLTDIVHGGVEKIVRDYVQSDKESLRYLDNEGPAIGEWSESLAVKFEKRYGTNGSIWDTLPRSVMEVYYENIQIIKIAAGNKESILNLIHRYTKQIFA